MKKKIISIIATVALIATFIPSSNTNAYTVQSFFTTVDGIEWGYCMSTEGKATDVLPKEIPDGVTEITVPEELDGYTVIEVATNAFARNETITKIDLPSNLEYIQENVFRDCTNLTSVNIPYGVSYIGESAFSDCLSLTSIEIPDSVTSIGTESFRNCRSLNYLRLSENLEQLGYMAFHNDVSLSHVEIPGNVKVINDNSFSNCSSLLTLDFSETSKLETIGLNAFSNCISLHYVNLPKSLTTIKDNAFRAAYSLEELRVPNSVTSIGEDSFDREGSSSLATVYLEENSYADGYKWDDTFNIKYSTEDVFENTLKVSDINTSTDVGYVGVPIKLVTGISGGHGDYQLQVETLLQGDGRFIVRGFCDDPYKDCYWTPSKAGDYTITSIVRDKNGARATKSVKYVVKVEEVEKFTIDTPTTDLVSPQKENTLIKVTAKAHGGSGKYKYTYNFSSNFTSLIANASSSEYSWGAKNSGTYKIIVTATEIGYVDGVLTNLSSVTSEPIEFTIVRPISMPDPIVNLVSPQTSGTTIGITAVPVNGYGKLKSKVEVTKDSVTTLVKDYSEETTTNWTPKESGSYTITVTALDEMGITVVKTLDYTITEAIAMPLEILYITQNLVSPQKEGVELRFQTVSIGGEGEISYKYEIKNGELYELVQDYQANASLTWTPSKSGKYTIKTAARDGKGTEVFKTFEFEITKKPLETKNFFSSTGKIDIEIQEIEKLLEVDHVFTMRFQKENVQVEDCRISIGSPSKVYPVMNKYILKTLTFTFNDHMISNEAFISNVNPKHILHKYSLGTNLAKDEVEMLVDYTVDPKYEKKEVFVYHIDSSNSFTLVDNDEVFGGRVTYLSKTLGDYIVLDTEIENALLEDLPPVVTPPEVTVPRTADGSNPLVIAFLIILSSTLLIVTSNKDKRSKVKVKK